MLSPIIMLQMTYNSNPQLYNCFIQKKNVGQFFTTQGEMLLNKDKKNFATYK